MSNACLGRAKALEKHLQAHSAQNDLRWQHDDEHALSRDKVWGSAHRKKPGNVPQLVGLQPVDQAILFAEALLKQLLVGAVDVAEPLAQMAIVTAAPCSAEKSALASGGSHMRLLSFRTTCSRACGYIDELAVQLMHVCEANAKL